ncbi:3-deoxy-D-arabinoheptulosonate-7-phosphate synthase [Allopseudospirillum japonicum]|uniref:Phospho-2-dehydro-3-deoxyheptonate aldolase n=1 Tax=Allopseudospirillum japonicum TaxID=64971 RepID=A0A1H6T3F7_9GAMM|nr:3-deoxy-7-phosphoheptulonate synthase [Allopseudospirillum japonicum]SEI70332.1 3-deoxy-D-arabinoheptulosonate-7-phosphate synthase [Allopseudospirillum japonicum]
MLTQAVISPADLIRQLPVDASLSASIQAHRAQIRRILHQEDKRWLLIVGPCSVHDVDASLEYAHALADLQAQCASQLKLVMRVYIEKPRTHLGWKGLAYDPHLDESDDLQQGLYLSRQLMRACARLGLAVATEVLSPLVVPYMADLVSWGAIGARTSESQTHREIASALPYPVGFKNTTDGQIQIAIQGMQAAARAHHRLTINAQGQLVREQTAGNLDTHLVLRGGHQGPNYSHQHLQAYTHLSQSLTGRQVPMLVDCNHANSGKRADLQPEIALDVLASTLSAQLPVVGLMLESFLVGGQQASACVYGQSITDPCLDWASTQHLILQIQRELEQARHFQSVCA